MPVRFSRSQIFVYWLCLFSRLFAWTPATDPNYPCRNRILGPGHLLLDCSGVPMNLTDFRMRVPEVRLLEVKGVEADALPDDFWAEVGAPELRLSHFDVRVRFSVQTGGELRRLEIRHSPSVFSWRLGDRGLERLTHLVVDDSPLYWIGAELGTLGALRFMEIRRSRVRWVHPEGLTRLSRLRLLCLSGNQLSLSDGRWLPDPAPELWHLDLSFNRIETLPPDLFSKAPKLRELKLDHNRLTTIPEPPQTLRLLWLQDNDICSGPFDQLSCQPFRMFGL